MTVSVAEARNKLTQLIHAVENGETVTVCRHGLPVVDIVKSGEGPGKKRKLGAMQGQIKIVDPDWWKPMTDEEADLFIEGRY